MIRKLLASLLLVLAFSGPVVAEDRWPIDGGTVFERLTFGLIGVNGTFILNNQCLLADSFPSSLTPYPIYTVPNSMATVPCTTNLFISETSWQFPTGANVRVKSMLCWMKGTGMTNGEVVTMGARWRDYTGTDQIAAGGATATLTVSGGGALVFASGPAGTTPCPYSTCGLMVRATGETLTTGTDVDVQCSVMVEYSY